MNAYRLTQVIFQNIRKSQVMQTFQNYKLNDMIRIYSLIEIV